MKYNKLLLFTCLMVSLSLTPLVATAQQQEHLYDPERKYLLAYELFLKEKFSASRDLFGEYLEDPKVLSVNNRINAEFFRALSGAELFHPDAENELVAFTEKYPESLKAKLAWFHAGKVLYKQKKYKQAVTYFEKADISYLNNEEIAEYYFKSGYSYFSIKDYTKASKSFHQILNVESKYKTAAIYYYAHVSYQNNNLNTALEYFLKLEDSESFGPVVPYYIIQIYYEQEKYDEVIRYAKALEAKGEIRNRAEIDRYVAESYYKKGDYKKALSMFQSFEKSYPRLSREDYYQLGYCHYQMSNYTSAIPYFEKVVNVKDALQQTAYFNLADCFLKANNKQSARNAFQFASKETFNKNLQEQSLFNYAKLSLELNYQPVAINALSDFLKLFPESKYVDEANELLAQLFITTRNYKDALIALDKIKDKSPKAKGAYQKVAYFRAIEFFNDRDYEKAIGLFNKAITTDVDQKIRAQAMYWKAEAIYNQNQYEAAIKQYRIFIFNPPSVNLPGYNTANYNMGYCYFKMENYAEANTWFRKYLYNKSETDAARYSDAQVRVGDGFLVMKDYDNALEFYNNAIAAKAKGSDYALYQTGIIQGIRGKIQDKIQTLNTLASTYPKSGYLSAASFEKGEALMESGDNEGAEKVFRQVMRDYPQSEFAGKALLKTALAQYNRKQDNEALITYKEVVRKYPSTSESVAALLGIRNIYIGQGNPQGYFDYVKTVSTVNISAGVQDSITYEAAEQLYMKGDNNNASRSFDEYLKKFPDGYFMLNATFYKAETDYRNKDYSNALSGYELVIEKPRNLFTERSLLRAATIQYGNKNYEEALKHFVRLEEVADFRDNIIESQAGQMRCYAFKNDHDRAIIMARKLIDGDKVSNQLKNEAALYYARAAMALNDFANAAAQYREVAKVMPNSDRGAEAKYSLALIDYKLANFKESQKKCFDVINQVPSYEYWIGKSFLLLGDNYVALNDTFQAKHTYRSIIENYERDPSDPEDIRESAKQKLEAIEQKESEMMQKEIEEKEKQYFGKEGEENGN